MRAITYVMKDVQGRTGAEAIIGTVRSQLEESAEKMTETRTSLVEATTEIRKASKETQDQLTGVSPHAAGAAPLPAGGPTRRSYAAAVANVQSPNPTHAAILAKSEIKARQVLVDVSPQAETNSLADMTERELVVKANIALALEWRRTGGGTERW